MTILLVGFLTMFFLIFLSGSFSASETAFFTLTREELRRLQLGSKRDRSIWELMKQPDRLLTGILFYNLLVNLTCFAVNILLMKYLVSKNMTFYAGIVSLLGLVGVILFGEVLPKSLAVLFRIHLARIYVRLLSAMISTLDPIMPALQRTAKGLRHGIWPHVELEPVLDAADLEQAVDMTHQSREVAEHERQVLHNILDLSEMTAEEVMRPRGSYLAIKPPITLKALKGQNPPGGYVLIAEEQGDQLQGVISLGSTCLNYPDQLERSREKILHLPWCAKLSDLLDKMRKKYISVVAVVNEFGETIGVVFYEDLIDTILAQNPSRARRILQHDPIHQLSENEYLIEGVTAMRHVAQVMDLDFDDKELESVTVIGYLQDQLERFPEVGDVVSWQNLKLTVQKTKLRGQALVHVHKQNPEVQSDIAENNLNREKE